ncbi:S-layer homology domain-containing protein [Paenibacillus faecis]|uniref:S-layer homology domain-containing protein n=1 Tax=Paenibacillus faecis TaxID=862114 RepID=A0A5D0CP50_9BACL|nr:S-layer homology domain-containing protein [Paenibacillus faecis]
MRPTPADAADAASIPAWAAPSVKAALGTGLLTGDPDGRFRPDQAVTGAEAAVAVYRLQEGLNR